MINGCKTCEEFLRPAMKGCPRCGVSLTSHDPVDVSGAALPAGDGEVGETSQDPAFKIPLVNNALFSGWSSRAGRDDLVWSLVGSVGMICLALSVGSDVQTHFPSWGIGQARGVFKVTASQGWNLESVSPAQAVLTTANNTSKVSVSAVDETPWHVQVYQRDFQLDDGAQYRLRFRAKADPARNVQVYASIGEGDYHHVGLDVNASLTPKWRTFELSFKASKAGGEFIRLPAFQLGSQMGSVWVSDVVLEAGEKSK